MSTYGSVYGGSKELYSVTIIFADPTTASAVVGSLILHIFSFLSIALGEDKRAVNAY